MTSHGTVCNSTLHLALLATSSSALASSRKRSTCPAKNVSQKLQTNMFGTKDQNEQPFTTWHCFCSTRDRNKDDGKNKTRGYSRRRARLPIGSVVSLKMASNVVKCNSCNVVINEVLAFICNRMDVMDEEGLSRVCKTAFSESEIENAKDLLFHSISTAKRKKTRKRDGKTLRNIDDILCLLKETDPEEIPIFVARDLEKIPPVLFDHVDVTRLLKDIVKMQREITQIKEQYATADQLRMLQLDLESLKNTSIVNYFPCTVNTKRGAATDSYEDGNSGPVGLPPICVEEEKKCKSPFVNLSSEGGSCKTPQPVRAERSARTDVMPEASEAANQRSRSSYTNVAERAPTQAPCLPKQTLAHTSASNEKHFVTQNEKCFADIVRDGQWKPERYDEGWIEVQRRRHKNRFIGNRGKAVTDPAVKFKAADVQTPMYIYNVAKEVTVCDIVNYIRDKCNITVTLEKMNMKMAKDYNAYKVFVPKYKLNVFMESNFWPEGVAFRRFINFDRQNKGREGTLKNVVANSNHVKIN